MHSTSSILRVAAAAMAGISRARAWRSACVAFALGAAVSGLADEGSKLPSGRDFGAGISLVQPTSLTEIAQNPERFSDRRVLVRAKLSDVCQKKGCWTVARQGDSWMRVRFKDYAFFLPTDSIGAEAYLEGEIKVVTLSEREARHYAEEAQGSDGETISGPVRELSMVASGVRLLPQP